MSYEITISLAKREILAPDFLSSERLGFIWVRLIQNVGVVCVTDHFPVGEEVAQVVSKQAEQDWPQIEPEAPRVSLAAP